MVDVTVEVLVTVTGIEVVAIVVVVDVSVVVDVTVTGMEVVARDVVVEVAVVVEVTVTGAEQLEKATTQTTIIVSIKDAADSLYFIRTTSPNDFAILKKI